MHLFQILIKMKQLIYFVAIMTSVASEALSFAVYFLWRPDVIIDWKRNAETQGLKQSTNNGGTLLESLKSDQMTIIFFLFLCWVFTFYLSFWILDEEFHFCLKGGIANIQQEN